MQVAKIAVAAALYAIDKPYDYRIPTQLAERVTPGVRVLAPFGRGNRLTEGMVLAVTEETTHTLKAIAGVLDGTPVVDADGLKLAYWMRERYFCTLYDALKAILPNGLWYHFRTEYALAPDAQLPPHLAQLPQVCAIWDALQTGPQKGERLQAVCGEDCGALLVQLEKAGVIVRSLLAKQKTADKSQRIVHLAIDVQSAQALAVAKRKSAPLQHDALCFLCENGSVSLPDLLYYTGIATASLRAMEKNGWIAYQEQEIFRVPEIVVSEAPPEIQLSEEQQTAFDTLLPMLSQKKPALALLQGVTGSGKTLVFLRLIQETIQLGQTALVLVPEIALTPQMMQRFSRYFGSAVAMLHSGLRATERYDQYKRIRQGQVKVVLGTRSAVFAPLRDLGLIVIDEEQESTYQSENAPRYDAREVARFRCAQSGGLLVLGSATPSVTTAYGVRSGAGTQLYLHRRFNQGPLPKVSLVDMRQELRSGNSGLISAPLRQALEETLLRGEQSILFLNRRGSSRLLLCGECGYVPGCPQCSVSMTYHKANGRLMCHYCGHSERALEVCPVCGGYIRQVGAGTQKVEEELKGIFPKTALLRMDADTVASAGGHEAILRQFEQKQIPILLGTQMVTKGLDFAKVTLVGVLDADLSLYVNHYQAAERTFDLLTQVVGRAGRGERPGQAVIQTFTPENDVILAAAAQDYERFYLSELRLRRQLRCPPFADLFTLTVSGSEESRVLQAAGTLRQALRQHAAGLSDPAEVLGPVAAPILKLNNRYRYRLTWVGHNDRQTRGILAACLRAFYEKRDNRGLQLSIDGNPAQ